MVDMLMGDPKPGQVRGNCTSSEARSLTKSRSDRKRYILDFNTQRGLSYDDLGSPARAFRRFHLPESRVHFY